MICGLMLACIRVQVLGCLSISQLYCGNETRSPVGTSYLLGANVHLLLNTPTLPSLHALLNLSPLQPNWSLRLLQLAVSFHFQRRSAWCQRRMAAEHRSRPEMPICLHGLYQSQTLSRISLATTRSCRWTLMVIHQKKVFSLQYLNTQWCSWWWETLVWFMIQSTVWIAIVPDKEHSAASVQNWRSTDWW